MASNFETQVRPPRLKLAQAILRLFRSLPISFPARNRMRQRRRSRLALEAAGIGFPFAVENGVKKACGIAFSLPEKGMDS